MIMLLALLVAACLPLALMWVFCRYTWTPGRHAIRVVAEPYRPALPTRVRFRHAARRPAWA